MEDYKLGVMETRFANLIWEHAPVLSGELVKLCEKEFDWKKSTTYTMLRRLCDKGIFQNISGVVSSLLSKNELQALQSERFIQESFNGSLPKFLAAFSLRSKLSDSEIDALQNIIDQHKE